MTSSDPFNLQRFVDAQANGVFEQALAELRDGAKRSHWMWFIFPQHADLGRSPAAKHFGLSGLVEARAYLDHPLLGPRLVACCQAVLPHLLAGKRAGDMLGTIDALKLKSSMDLFVAAAPGKPLFARVLAAAG